MRKIKEVLRLRHELGLGQRQIARSCSIAQSTVHQYLRAAERAGVKWPLPADWDDPGLEQVLFGGRPEPSLRRTHNAPDFAAIHQELQTHPHLTLQLVWEEYRQGNPDGYRYSRFCELYRRWHRHLDVVLRQEHRAGEKLFVDYAGDKVPIVDPETGEVRQAAIFVAVLGASSYTFAEATESQDLACWIGSHIRAFEFFGGTPKLVVPDNCRTGVSRACRYEPDLNRTYHEMATHYGVGVLPTRPYKPRDKAKVEAGVLLVERWIVAALRHRRFFNLAELNQAIAELLVRLNQRPFRKREGSRASLFAAIDRPALQPLPAERYQFSEWRTARVNIDYHVEVDRHYYSVPYQLTGEQVEARSTSNTVEVFHRGRRVASHARSREPYQATTIDEHRPRSHQQHLAWPPSRLLGWAETIGPATASLFERILNSKPHPEMGYRSCLGTMRLAKKYTSERVEAAAARALLLNVCSYRSVKSMLEHGLDRQPVDTGAPARPPIQHGNIRGPRYFDPLPPSGTNPSTIQ
jgi:transposase